MRMIDPKAGSNRLYVSDFVIEQMQKIPTIDAVPVVWCKDCVHWQTWGKDQILGTEMGVCRCPQWKNDDFNIETESYDFCSYGERKDGEE